MWIVEEEIQQFNIYSEYKHDIPAELYIYNQLKELYVRKFNYKFKADSKRSLVMEFGQEFNKLSQDSEFLTKLQKQAFENHP